MRTAAIISMLVLSGLTTARAEEPIRSAIIDVAVTPSGEFVSQCQNATGHAVAGVDVGLYLHGTRVASTTSAPDGWFTLRGVRPGVYELKSGDWQHTVRLWTPETAPPGANDPIALILETPSPAHVPIPATIASSSDPPAESGSPGGTPVAEPVVAAAAAPVEEPVVALATAERTLTKPNAATQSFNPFAHAPLPGDEAPAPAPPLPEWSQPQASELPPSEQQQAAVQTADVSVPAGQTASGDAVFNPFYETANYESEPLPGPGAEELAPLPPDYVPPTDPEQVPELQGGDPQLQGPGPDAGPPPPAGPPPEAYSTPAYVTGPTVGNVVTASAVLGGIAVGAVAIYKYDNRRDNVRNVVSP